MSKYLQADAWFSPDKLYRYALLRKWGPDADYAMFIGLNPSTADANLDDPTIRRCVQFAKDWGYSGMAMLNLFAYRATKPTDMLLVDDPIGPENDNVLKSWAANAGVVVAAWGGFGKHLNRNLVVKAMIPNLHYLYIGKGEPWHPLYLPKTLTPKPMSGLLAS